MQRIPPLANLFLTFAVPALTMSALEAGIDRWTSSGPGLQDVVAVELDTADSRTVYVVAGTNRLLRSTDAGQQWEHFDLTTTRLNTLRAVPGRPGFLYVAGSDMGDRFKSNVFLSTDYGATWQSRGSLLSGEPKSLAVDPRRPDVVYFVTTGYLRKTTDGGLTWDSLDGAPGGIQCLAADHFNSNLLYAGTSSVWTSTDGGMTWSGPAAALPRQAVVESLATDPSTPGGVYAGMEGGGIYKSTDQGASWKTVPAPVANTHVPAIVPHAVTGGVVYVLSKGTESAGVFRSGDAGLTWTRIGLPVSPASGLAIDPANPSIMYVGTTEGLAKTTDTGASWKLINPGLLAVYIYQGGGGIARGAGGVLYAWNDYGGFRSTDSAGSWVALPRITDDPYVEYRLDKMYASPLVPGLAAVTSKQGLNVSGTDAEAARGAVPQAANTSLMLTRDGGFHWEAVQGVTGHVWTVLFDAVRPERLYVRSDEGLQRSDDGGLSWRRPAGSGEPYAITLLTQDPSRPDSLLADTGWDGIWKSDDAGASWSQLSPRLGNCHVGYLEVSSLNSQVILMGGCGLMRSEDGGLTWKSIDLGLPADSWVSAVRFHASSGHAYLSFVNRKTGGGVMRSTDAGLSWARIAEGGSVNPVDLLVSEGQPTTLWTLDQDYGVFAYTFSQASAASVRVRRDEHRLSTAFNTVTTAVVPFEISAPAQADPWLQSAVTSASSPVGWSSFGPSSGEIGQAVVDPFNPQNVYFEPADAADVHYPSEGLHFRSTDAGVSWEIWDAGDWWNLSFGASPGLMYRARYIDLEKSTDSGKSWQPLGLTMVNSAVPDPFDPQTVWALRRDSIDKSTDGGASWRTLFYLHGSRMVLDPKSTRIAYAAGTSSYGTRTVRTLDGGETWAVTGIREGEDMLADPERPGCVYLADPVYGVLKSTDDGWTWTPANNGLPRPEAWRLAYDPAEHVLYCGVSASSEGTVFKSTDAGASWQATDPSLEDTIRSLTVIAPGCLLAGAPSGVYRTTDAGTTWNRIEEGLAMPAVYNVSVTPAAPDVIYIQTSAGLFRSDNAGGQWIPIKPELNAGETIFSLAASPTDDSLLLLSTYTAVYLSHDRGDSWIKVLEIVPAWRQSCHITFAPDNPHTFYVTVTGHSPFPAFQYWAAMYRTRDGGQTWVTLPIDEDAWVSEPVSGPDGLVFIVQEGKLWRSTNQGDSWISTADLHWYDWQIAGSSSNPSVLYGATDCRVWQSRDLGATWRQVAEFPYGYTVTSLVVDPLDSDRVYAAAGDSVYSVKASQGSARLLARGPFSDMLRIAVMPFRRVLLVAPGLHYQGLYVTSISPLHDRPRHRR